MHPLGLLQSNSDTIKHRSSALQIKHRHTRNGEVAGKYYLWRVIFIQPPTSSILPFVERKQNVGDL